MGACASSPDRPKETSDPEANHENISTPEPKPNVVDNQIGKDLKADERRDRSSVKLLLLGAGECGKSTILKQMKILHKSGFTPEERQAFVDVVTTNTLQSIKFLIQGCFDLKIPFHDPKLEESAQNLLLLTKLEANQEIIQQITDLYSSSTIQFILTQTSKFYSLDSGPYFLSQVDRILQRNYLPTDADILRTRLPTSGIIDTEFSIDSLNFHLFDVGGQRGERKKWIHCFQSVHAILFIASLNEFDQQLAEDQTKNRFTESVRLFEGIISLPWFRNTHIILFLNKHDLFMEKIQRVGLSEYFENFSSDFNHNYEESLEFLKEQYFSKNLDPDKIIYAHVTDATDTKQIEFVWGATKQIIVQKNLLRAGLIT